ncbi:MAG: NAD(P)H-dependent oxidoreductase [Actinomycetota bacterium]
MRVLLIDAFGAADPDRAVVDATVAFLGGQGHQVTRLVAAETGGGRFMSAAERNAYHEDAPLLDTATQASAAAVAAADALLFCYPTTTFTVPAALKAWLERVLVPGVAFTFDASGRVTPGMTNIRRLGVVTTVVQSRLTMLRARDGGRRTILRTLRLNCHRRCGRTFLRIPAGGGSAADPAVARTFRNW